MSLTMNGKTTTKAKVSSSSFESPIIIRQAHIWEGTRLGEIASTTHFNTPLTKFLAPYRQKYRSHYVRRFTERSQGRLLNPRCLTFVACEANNPSYAIGYAAFARFGDDEGAKKQIASRKSIWLWALSWLFWMFCKVLDWFVGGDKSVDPKHVAEFESWGGPVEKQWSFPERKNRWHACSVVVLPEFQGRGIGKKLMAGGMERAEKEGVCVGLEASGPGYHLYRSLGFKLLERFNTGPPDLREEGGGVMMWTPSSWDTKTKDLDG